ncbi:MAG: hypothetical protein IPM38_10340 [Ignavibacteria bacterium]|nr:hypothetical protein [Ignavibacteria bacterium]
MEIKKYKLKPVPRIVNVLNVKDNIYLSVVIGNGQIGGNKVTSDGKLLAKGNLSEPAFIGTVSELIEKEIEIETNVLDVNAFTNVCVITSTILNQENQVLFTKIDHGAASESGIANFTGKYIINILTFLFLLFVCITADGYAQNNSEELTFQNLETPTSPGFILLDEAPASIERPTTPQGFGLSIIGFFQGTGGAMEFAPYWLTSHPKLTAEIMTADNFPVLYNLSVSVTSVKADNNNYLTGGFRTRVYQSYGKSQSEKLRTIKKEIENELSESSEDLEIEKIEQLRKEYVGITEKPVFNIDIAGAVGGGSVTNSFDDLVFSRWAAWLSLNIRPGGDDFYFTVLSRYLYNKNFEEYTVKADLADVGTRLNYDIGQFCLSLEYLQRLDLTENNYNDNRIAVIGSYKFSDNLYITSTFGKNFSKVNNIIALAGINFGFSRSKVKAF